MSVPNPATAASCGVDASAPPKTTFELDDADYEAADDDGLIMMNNDFYNDDFYDYKDTFMQHKATGKASSNASDTKKRPNVAIEASEDYENGYSEGEGVAGSDSEDENYFTSGPLAAKPTSESAKVELPAKSHYAESDSVGQLESGPNHTSSGPNGGLFNADTDEDNDEQQDLLMMDTFFKRVDSLDIVKPKKTKIVHNYLIGELLGDGSYGKVKECLDLRDLSRRAVKIINLKMIARKIPRGVENVRKEIAIMRRLEHKNVIKLHDTFEKPATTTTTASQSKRTDADADELLASTAAQLAHVNIEKPPKLYIFMDYCITSLEKLLKHAPEQRLRNWQANYYFRQLVDGLDYLHSLNIIHNDIKPGNLLITCDDTLKICDFSISAQLGHFYEQEYKDKLQADNDNNQTSSDINNNEEDEEHEISPNLLPNSGGGTSRFPILQCTPMFQCPEMLDEDLDELKILRNAPKIDIWSSGITLYQLVTGALPFQGQTIHQIFESIRSAECEIRIPDFIDKNLAILLRNLLNRDPEARWSLKQIRDAEWFRKKHPVVREELAALPDDVVNNEYATFRMISYLEKLCQETKATDAAATNANNEPMIASYYSDNDAGTSSMQHNYADSNHTNNNLAATEHNYDPNGLSLNSTAPGGATLSSKDTAQQSQPTGKQYTQATKVKRSHCSLM